ncbi:MAG: phosphate ABC transporter ATP-binding protein PstB [Acidobacteriota bacterium]
MSSTSSRVPRVLGDTASANPEAASKTKSDETNNRELALNPRIDDPLLEIKNLSLWYGDKQALQDISMKIPKERITAFIGPSGCGKSTLLRCINRLNDMIPIVRVEGEIGFEQQNLLGPDVDINLLRKRIGMVFQRYNPFPKSIYENVVFGLRLQGINDKAILDEAVERSLHRAALWEEVKDRLDERALGMSGGQQQRLCIARAIAVEPEVILYDEPCSALDPISTAKVEDLMLELKDDYTQIIVTHNMQQASRISDFTAFMYLGELIEYGPTDELFVRPRTRQTEDYITGRFG